MDVRSRTQTEVWVAYGGHIIAWFCFLLMIQLMNPSRHSVSPPVLVVFAAAVVGVIAMGFVMRKKFFAQSVEALPADPQKALNRWRAANLIGFTFAMNPTILGVVLKFLGASWLVPSILFAVGLGLLVLWRPRSNLTGYLP